MPFPIENLAELLLALLALLASLSMSVLLSQGLDQMPRSSEAPAPAPECTPRSESGSS